jgi:phosphatidate cytidylyltransferase
MSQRKLRTDKLPSPQFKEEKDDFFNEFSEIDTKKKANDTDVPPEVQQQAVKKNMMTRIKTGLSIFGAFFFINLMGHFYCALFVYAIQIGIFREIISLKRNYIREKPVKVTVYILWYLFLSSTAFIFFWYFSDKLYFTYSPIIQYILRYKHTIFFGLYTIGFLAFVLSLKMGYIRYQIRLFIETHLVILIAVGTSGAMMTIYEGQIWWIASAGTVILNDVCAYQVGVVFGRTKLIDLSPKKTVEGFIGGLFGTFIAIRLVNSLGPLHILFEHIPLLVLSPERAHARSVQGPVL